MAAPKLLPAAILALPLAAACGGEPPARRPNVLILLLDTLRADRCGFLGCDRPTTPRLDAFAKDAVVFEECWSPASWTLAAHGSLFTGLRPPRHSASRDDTSPLDDSYETLAERLRSAGWATAAFSNNPYVTDAFGLTQGFDRADFRDGEPHRDYPWSHETHIEALAWMMERRSEGRPFFAYVNDMEPHYPYTPPPAEQAAFVRPSVPGGAVESIRRLAFPRIVGLSIGADAWRPGEREALRDLYDAEIAALDKEVGALFDGMAAAGLLDDTTVVVTSDHGEGLADHGWIEHGVFLHRELLRVPLVVREAARFRGGRRVADVVRLEDVFPTVLESCGLDVPSGIDGQSLARDLPGRVARASSGEFRQWATKAAGAFPKSDVSFLRTTRRSAFDGRWHLIASADGRAELYDTKADPGEKDDRAAAEPATVERLRALLDR